MKITTMLRALDVLAAIEGQTKARAFPPTLLEVGAEVGISSSSHVAFYIKLLVEMGLLSYEPRIPCSFVVLVKDEDERNRRVNEFIMTRYASTDRVPTKRKRKLVPVEKKRTKKRHEPTGVKETV
jgi:hypothetical protein